MLFDDGIGSDLIRIITRIGRLICCGRLTAEWRTEAM